MWLTSRKTTDKSVVVGVNSLFFFFLSCFILRFLPPEIYGWGIIDRLRSL
jgi:hypothetical protein